MANFPSVLNTFTRPTTTDKLNSPSHSGLHNTVSSALSQVEAFLGVVGDNSVVGTLSYNVRSPASDGGGHIQAVNKGGTGLTAFTKGDLLVGQSSSVLTKLAVSATQGYALITDSTTNVGLKWGLPGNTPTMRIYATPSVLSSTLSWSKPSNLSYVVVECVGGGGAGFNGGAADDGGGGGGGYAKATISASSVQSSMLIYVGGGGALAGVGATGLAGGNTSFGGTPLVLATGGSGGETSAGGGGGIGSIGTLFVNGGSGKTVALGGTGGPTFYGPGGTYAGGGTAYGEGGNAQAAGNSGAVIITEY
jgi:hypothetical protein